MLPVLDLSYLLRSDSHPWHFPLVGVALDWHWWSAAQSQALFIELLSVKLDLYQEIKFIPCFHLRMWKQQDIWDRILIPTWLLKTDTTDLLVAIPGPDQALQQSQDAWIKTKIHHQPTHGATFNAAFKLLSWNCNFKNSKLLIFPLFSWLLYIFSVAGRYQLPYSHSSRSALRKKKEAPAGQFLFKIVHNW